VFVDGEDITKLDIDSMRQVRRRKLAMVFQHFALFPHKTVVDNVAYGLKVQKVEPAERHDRAMETLELVGLAEWAERHPHNLSGGMQQRVGLARALATDPDILLMDEPFASIDAQTRELMQIELMQLWAKRKCVVLFVTHSVDEAILLSDKIVLMNDGKIVQAATPRDLYRRPSTLFAGTFIGDANVVSGRVASVDTTDSRVCLDTGSGRFEVSVSRDITNVSVDDRASVLLRQEDVTLANDSEPVATNLWKAEVTAASFMGSRTEYVVSIGELRFRVQLSPTDCFEGGDDVALTIDPQNVIWLDE
jgi:glycine betaine/proline transport system ATP-binding protein